MCHLGLLVNANSYTRDLEENASSVYTVLQWSWIGFIALGYYLDFDNWKLYTVLLAVYWGTVVMGIYLPMLYRKLRNRPTGYVD